ncbi:MAG: bacillithiol biosynthesis protein BshC [Candidatus Thorarchaeota archaeon]|nr:MAG: hypothetical protein DRP09_09485 [Candidatus Thorarchaeota archaeon]
MPKSVQDVYHDFIWNNLNQDLAETLYDTPLVIMHDLYSRAPPILEKYRETLWHLPEKMSLLKKELISVNRNLGALTPGVHEAIETLESGAVEAAHQTVALGGPVYILNKAATAHRIATMTTERGLNLAPFFCVADYDIVQPELTNMRTPLMGKEGNLVSIPVPEEYKFSPVSQLPLPGKDWYEQVEESIRANYRPMFKALEGSARKVVDERLEQALSITRWAYINSTTAGNWAQRILARLFNIEGDLGIPLVPASSIEIRNLLVEGMEFLLSRKARERCLRAFDDTTTLIIESGYNPGMGRRDSSYVPFFYECPNEGCHRSRMELHYIDQGATVVLAGTCPTCGERIEIETPADTPYLGEVATHLSPRVDSRQFLVDTIIPTVAHIGGPGETAYYAQVIPCSKALDIPFPLFIKYPRVYFNTHWGESLGKSLEEKGVTILHRKDLFSIAGKITRFRRKERYDEMNDALSSLHDLIVSTHAGLNEHLREIGEKMDGLKGKDLHEMRSLKLEIERYLSWAFGQYAPGKIGQESSWSWIDWAVSAGFPDLLGPYERAYVGPMKNGATLFVNLSV